MVLTYGDSHYVEDAAGARILGIRELFAHLSTMRAVQVEMRPELTADCVRGFGFLAELREDEELLARDAHQREDALKSRLLQGLSGMHR